MYLVDLMFIKKTTTFDNCHNIRFIAIGRLMRHCLAMQTARPGEALLFGSAVMLELIFFVVSYRVPATVKMSKFIQQGLKPPFMRSFVNESVSLFIDYMIKNSFHKASGLLRQ